MKTLNPARLLVGAATFALGAAMGSAMTPAFAQTGGDANLSQPLNAGDVRHALTRTSFGAAPADLRAFVGQPRSALVASILDDTWAPDAQPLPQYLYDWPIPVEFLYAKNETLGELALGQQFINLQALQGWWAVEMIGSDSPFKEQITLFWMDHFVTSFENHEDAQLTASKFLTIRNSLNGSFRDMLALQLRDPAMLLYLSNVENVKGAPNENLARELLELFTLGQGRGYTEADIREVARALTGYGIDERGQFRLWEGQHDDGKKTIFGQSGRFNADNLPDLILAQPAFGPYIAEQLWRYFISETPDPAQIDIMVARWRAADWDLPTLYRALLETPAFWEPGNHGTLIKSPIELFVGFNRSFGTAPSYLGEIADWSEQAGQALFFPPNVAGWQEGPDWINDSSLALRSTALRDLGEMWIYDDFEGGSAAAAPVTGQAAQAQGTETSGFRVGEVALGWAWQVRDEDWQETGVELQLYDVGFRGQTFRDFRFFVGAGQEASSSRGESEIYLGVGSENCGAGCPLQALLARTLPYVDEDGFEEEADEEAGVEFFISPDDMSEGVRRLSGDEADFLAALVRALPELIKAVRDDQTWAYLAEDAAEDPGESVPTFGDVQRAATEVANRFARRGTLARALRQAPSLERGYSRPNSLGLAAELLALAGPASAGATPDEERVDDVYGALYEVVVARYQARLSETHAGPQDWLAALPADLRTAEAIEGLLLPVPNPDLATASFAIEDDDSLEQLLTALILDPRFNLK